MRSPAARTDRTRRPRQALVVALLLVPTLAIIPLAAAAPPGNDDVDSAVVIPSLPYTNSLDTREATTAGDDPTCSGLGRAKSVWYSYTSISDVVIRVNTAGSNYETVLGIFRGPRGAYTSSACANDPVGGGVSEVSMNVPAGTTVHIMIAGRTGSTGGDLKVNVALAPPPPPPTAPITLTLQIDPNVATASRTAYVGGVATLDRGATGTLCIHARLFQPGATHASSFRCFAVDHVSRIPFALDIHATRVWGAAPGTAYVTGYFFGRGTADSDSVSRVVTLMPM